MICPHCSGYIKVAGRPRKLTLDQVIEAKAKYRSGVKLKVLAAEHRVSEATMWRAVGARKTA